MCGCSPLLFAYTFERDKHAIEVPSEPYGGGKRSREGSLFRQPLEVLRPSVMSASNVELLSLMQSTHYTGPNSG